MKIFISVISHGHSDLINQLDCLRNLTTHCQVIIKSNKSGDNFESLTNSANFHHIDSLYSCGFGHNNNIVFNYCDSVLGMAEDDYFVVMNPDVIISFETLSLLIERMKSQRLKLSSINLFKKADFSEYDNSIRRFPTILQFTRSFLGLGNSAVIDKSTLSGISEVDWAAGSFLAFKASHYRYLRGFDEGYFMYCEDIDICYRSNISGTPVSYHSDITAVHLAEHANRKIFSRHFVWHFSSVVRFSLSKLKLTKQTSCIKPKNCLSSKFGFVRN